MEQDSHGGAPGIKFLQQCTKVWPEILSTRQYMLAGLKKVVRDTERSEHTAICPTVPFQCPPHLLTTREQSEF